MRLILPVFNSDEYERIFGAAISIAMEDKDNLSCIEFTCTNIQAVQADAHGTTPPANLPRILSPKNSRSRVITGALFQLRAEHMAALRHKIVDEEFAQLCADFEADYITGKPDVPLIGVKAVSLEVFLRTCFKKCEEFNIDSHYGKLQFFDWSYTYRWQF